MWEMGRRVGPHVRLRQLHGTYIGWSLGKLFKLGLLPPEDEAAPGPANDDSAGGT